MIGRLRGVIIEKLPPEIVIDINGIGYEVSMPITCFYALPDCGQEAVIFTHLVVRDDAHLLYGFSGKRERRLFRELIKVNGVGPKLALAILSGMSASQFIEATQQGEIESLVKLPGVGKKTAERLVVEMKDRLSDLGEVDGNDVNLPTLMSDSHYLENSIASEAISALVALGYKPHEAKRIIKKVNRDGVDSQTLIKEALRSAL